MFFLFFCIRELFWCNHWSWTGFSLQHLRHMNFSLPAIKAQLLYSHMPYHNDTIINRRRKTSLTKYIPLNLFARFKGFCGVLLWEGAGDRTETAIFWPHSYGHQRWVFLILLMLNQRPRGQLCWVMAFFTASYQQLLWISNSIGRPDPLLPGVAFPTTFYLLTPSTSNWNSDFLSWLSYIIVQRPLNRLLDLWNGVWSSSSGNNCHAVHRSLSSGESVYECTMGIFFSSSHFISQFPPTQFPLITATRMCHFLPVHHLEWHFWPGRRSKYNTTCTERKMVENTDVLQTKRSRALQHGNNGGVTHPWYGYVNHT